MGRNFFYVVAVAVTLAAISVTGQEAKDFQITADMVGLSDGNKRTAEPYEIRAYPAKADGNTPDRSKGPVWIGSKSNPEYKLGDAEVAVFHNALDISSRGPDGKPAKLEFKAGVYGTVVAARPGFIAVQMPDGNIIQYLHASKALAKPGQAVTPGTPLGVTGDVGTKSGNIHLHVQAVDKDGKVLNVDRAFLAGRNEKRDRTIKWVVPKWVDVGPMLIDTKKRPKVGADGIVRADAANKRIYYDDDAPKGAVSASKSALEGTTWLNTAKSVTSQGRMEYTFGPGNTFRYYYLDFPSNKEYREVGVWKLEGNKVLIDVKTWTRQSVLIYQDGVLIYDYENSSGKQRAIFKMK